jgi:hypothetical protein
MTLTLTLSPEKESRLAERARLAGLPLDEYALRVLDADAEAVTPQVARTGADLIAQWEREGAFLPADPDMDSPALARALREKAETRP